MFIGVRLDRHTLRTTLESALLTDAELAETATGLQTYPDPLPAWDLLHTHL